jgi:type IV pilus assembly protein PilA
MRQNKGFSLVELMIVVAIIGILAAIAIPNFVAMQLKAKRSEVPGNIDGVKTAEQAFDAAYDGFIDCAVQPRSDGALDKSLANWTTDPNWTSLGWKPDGMVRGNYNVTVSSTTTSSNDFTVTGKADVDNDGSIAQFTATNSLNSFQVTQNDVY